MNIYITAGCFNGQSSEIKNPFLKYNNMPYLGPPDMTGQLVEVQNSDTVPYIKLTRLKKSTTIKRTTILDNKIYTERNLCITTLGIQTAV